MLYRLHDYILRIFKNSSEMTENEEAMFLICKTGGEDSTKALNQLIKKGVRINITDRWGRTALHWASENGFESLVRSLLSHGAKIDVGCLWKKTPLHCAAMKGRSKCLKLLVDHGCNVNALDLDNRSPVLLAAWGGHANCLEYLLKNKGLPNLVSTEKRTALHWAVGGGHLECVRLLLKFQADIHKKDELHFPITLAVRYGFNEILKLLINHKANIDTIDEAGMSLLHHAVEGNSIDCLVTLLNSKAKTNIENKIGLTPLQLAKKLHYAECQLLLESA